MHGSGFDKFALEANLDAAGAPQGSQHPKGCCDQSLAHSMGCPYVSPGVIYRLFLDQI